MLIQAIATVRGPGLVYETPTQIRGEACTEVSLGGGVAHAPPITDVQTDVHIVPVDCDLTVHNLLILPTPCVVMVHGLGIYSLSGAPFTVTKRV